MANTIPLHDGAHCSVSSAYPGTATLAVHDAHGGEATVTADRVHARQIADAILSAAGLAPTAPRVDLAAALAGSLRILLQRIDDDLERVSPAAADQLRIAMIAHLRSKRPALLGGGVL